MSDTRIRWLLSCLYADVVRNYEKHFLNGQTIQGLLKEWGVHKDFWVNVLIVSMVGVAIAGLITIDRAYPMTKRGYALEATLFSLGLFVLSMGKLIEKRNKILAPLESFIELFDPEHNPSSIFLKILWPGGMIPEMAREKVFNGFVELARGLIKAEEAVKARGSGFVNVNYEAHTEKLKAKESKLRAEYDTAIGIAIKLELYRNGDRKKHVLRACRPV